MEMKNKTWYVALDRPGAGWNMMLEASSKNEAIKLCLKEMGETPDTVYPIEGTLSEALLRRENQALRRKLEEITEKFNDLCEELNNIVS